jgi:hypothetical protein
LREIVDEEIRAYWNPPGSVGVAGSPDQSGPSEARKLEGIEKDIIFDGWPVLQWRVTLTNGQEMGWAFPMG